MTIGELLQSKRSAILKIAAAHGASNVRVIGSAARGEDGPTSDIDVLVDLEPGRSLLDHVALKQDLQALLDRPVDVVVDGGLSPHLKQRILSEARAL